MGWAYSNQTDERTKGKCAALTLKKCSVATFLILLPTTFNMLFKIDDGRLEIVISTILLFPSFSYTRKEASDSKQFRDVSIVEGWLCGGSIFKRATHPPPLWVQKYEVIVDVDPLDSSWVFFYVF